MDVIGNHYLCYLNKGIYFIAKSVYSNNSAANQNELLLHNTVWTKRNN